MANAGDKVGAYELVELIGEGGMGVVWRAKHPHLDRHVALKINQERRAYARRDKGKLSRRNQSLESVAFAADLTSCRCGDPWSGRPLHGHRIPFWRKIWRR